MKPVKPIFTDSPLLNPHKQPSAYPRRVLLAVSGLSPQIVTETIYSLAADPAIPFIPTEVQLITALPP